MPTIWYKKQQLGKWRRDDGEIKKLVNEETMFREMMKLINDGWSVIPHGVTHTRVYEIVKDSPNRPTRGGIE
jgi:hypothetical protein